MADRSDNVGTDSSRAIARQIRGSSLLLVGRGLSIAISLGVQVLIVRYLSKAAFGSFAYGLSIVALVQTFVTFGLHRAIPRFAPIYEERGEYEKFLGLIVFVAGLIGAIGAATVATFILWGASVSAHSLHDRGATALLAVLIVLAPLQALDSALMSLFGVLGRPRAIFVRTYLLAPGLKLAVVLLVIAAGRGVLALAVGYVAATAAGIVLYAVVLVTALREQGLVERAHFRRIRVPAREVLALTAPLLTTDLVYVLLLSTDAILLGHFRGAAAVGSFRVIQPAAALNELVLASFVLLYTPLAARLFARGDEKGIRDLYWQTAAWVAVVSFPIFALTFAGARPLTTILFGDRYASSALFLSILACGYFVQAALGFNGTTLTVFGRVRGISVLNVLAMVVNVGLNLLLIPRWGALGAAVGTAATLVVHNVFKQIALYRATGIAVVDPRYAGVYLRIAAAIPVLVAIRWGLPGRPALAFAAIAAVTLLVILTSRRFLRLGEAFPELRRLPVTRWMFAPQS
jgi:O-antigen/teichoic acid export membrane protein